MEALIFTFAQRYRHVYQPIDAVSPDLIKYLQTQAFEGNVRELENSVLRMLFEKTQGCTLTKADWFAQTDEPSGSQTKDLVGEAGARLWELISTQGLPFAKAMDQVERQVLEVALRTGVTRRNIAKSLQTSERTLYHKMRTHQLSLVLKNEQP